MIILYSKKPPKSEPKLTEYFGQRFGYFSLRGWMEENAFISPPITWNILNMYRFLAFKVQPKTNLTQTDQKLMNQRVK